MQLDTGLVDGQRVTAANERELQADRLGHVEHQVKVLQEKIERLSRVVAVLAQGAHGHIETTEKSRFSAHRGKQWQI